MSLSTHTIGIVGGSGMLGLAISEAILKNRTITAGNFWISNRSGNIDAFEQYPGVMSTIDNQELVDACDLIVLCIPPGKIKSLSIKGENKLFVSVMAGVSIQQLHELTGSARVVRAMSSPAAASSAAYSPWVAAPAVTAKDRDAVNDLFNACGMTDEVDSEDQVELFTAMTGPVPGFVAYFAQCMTDYATERGIPPKIADRATRQLFLAAGQMMSDSIATPAEHVQQMIDYDGTTAAGLDVMRHSSLGESIAAGLDAALEKTRQLTS